MARSSAGLISLECATVTENNGPSSFSCQKARSVAAAKSKPAKKARPKQRIAISHHREEDFKADGLRTYAQYRDLGIAAATHGLAPVSYTHLTLPTKRIV